MSAALKPYTVFCREKSRLGTTWISQVDAATPKAAQSAGLKQCLADWGPGYKGCIEAYCVIEGAVKVAVFVD